MEIANILFIFMTAPEDASSFLAIEYAGTILEKMLANTMVITSWMLNTALKDDKRHEDRTGDCLTAALTMVGGWCARDLVNSG